MPETREDEDLAPNLGKRLKLSRKAAPKNKSAAPVQITAEQLLREAKEREMETLPPPPVQKIQDEQELDDYLRRKRKEFEDIVRKNRTTMTAYCKYAAWEDNRGNTDRARSIYERAIDQNHRDIQVWLRYLEMEQKNKQVQHARNVFDRAVTIMPRADQFWYKYVFMEETLNNISGCRAVFERWMEWEPDEQAWSAYINFETRYHEIDRIRGVYERLIVCHPTWKNWQKYAKFEERQNLVENARHVYERAIEFFMGDAIEDDLPEILDSNLLIAFAKFEERQKETERARVIYKYGLDTLLKNVETEEEKNKLSAENQKVKLLLDAYTRFEKQFGSRAKIESRILEKRKAEYENRVTKNSHDYDAWFDYIRLMENTLPKDEDDHYEEDLEKIRDIYERSIVNIPPAEEKRYWRRYIYLWINYAVFEELTANNAERATQAYEECLKLIPHHKFTYAKVWIMYSHFNIRQNNLAKARKILGTALGKCPKGRLFKAYIELETELREFDRVRTLYNKYILFNTQNCQVWINFAQLEAMLGDTDRCRAIYTLGVKQEGLDMPEVLWKSFIDFEVQNEEWENARNLYKRLLKKTNHIKVWIALCQFEYQALPKKKRYERTAATFEQAAEEMRIQYKQSKNDAAAIKAREDITEEEGLDADQMIQTALENRLTILDSWQNFEKEQKKTAADVEFKLKQHLPKRVKKRRKVAIGEDGETGGWEEYWDYIFPEEVEMKSSLKLLQMAKAWKEKKAETEQYDPTEQGPEPAQSLKIPVPSYNPTDDAGGKDGEIDISDEDD